MTTTVKIPLKWSSALLTSALSVACGSGADAEVTDTDANGKTDANTWAEFEIEAIEIEGVAHASAAPLLGMILVNSLVIDGGADLVPEDVPIPIEPISAVEGKFHAVLRGLRKGEPLRLGKNQRATIGLELKAWATASATISSQVTASLICKVVRDDG